MLPRLLFPNTTPMWSAACATACRRRSCAGGAWRRRWWMRALVPARSWPPQPPQDGEQKREAELSRPLGGLSMDVIWTLPSPVTFRSRERLWSASLPLTWISRTRVLPTLGAPRLAARCSPRVATDVACRARARAAAGSGRPHERLRFAGRHCLRVRQTRASPAPCRCSPMQRIWVSTASAPCGLWRGGPGRHPHQELYRSALAFLRAWCARRAARARP